MERFEYVSSLGEGAYGVVWLCVDRETGEKVAMKRFKDAHTDPEVMRLALREVRLLKAAQHSNVVKMLEAFRSKSGRVYIAMEYVERTLTQDLRKYHGKGFPPLLAKMLAYQLLMATKHLHAHKIMHRDLKPANILLSADYDLKLCDFGFARTLHPREIAEYTTYVVTRWYRAPEILVSDAYGPKVDTWAIGCLLSEMAGGRPLFPGKSSADQMWLTIRTLGSLPARQQQLMSTDKLYTGTVWPTAAERTSIRKRFPQFPDDLLSLLHGCLALDPAERMSTDDALAHPYFEDVPQLLATIAATGRPAAEFWEKIDEVWMAAVAANGNNVSSPAFMRTNKSHSQLNSLLCTDTDCLDDSDEGGNTPNAPIGWLRRGLTSHSQAGNALMHTQDMLTTGQDFQLTSGTSLCPTSMSYTQTVPGGPLSVNSGQDGSMSHHYPHSTSLSADVNQQRDRSTLEPKNGAHTVHFRPRQGSSTAGKPSLDLNGSASAPGSGPPSQYRSRLAGSQSSILEQHDSSTEAISPTSTTGTASIAAATAATAAKPAPHKQPSWMSMSASHAVVSSGAGMGPLARARSIATDEASTVGHHDAGPDSRSYGAGPVSGGAKLSQRLAGTAHTSEQAQPDSDGFLGKLRSKFKSLMTLPQAPPEKCAPPASGAIKSGVLPPLADTHLIGSNHMDVM